MGRIYTIPVTGTLANANGDTDIWEITPASNAPVAIRGICLGQTSEVQDAAEEGVRITVKRLRATVTSGSGGSAGAPESVSRANQAPSFSSETLNGTVATTTGDTEILDELGWNIRNTPYERWYPDKDFAPKAVNGEVLVVRLEDTVADDVTFVGNIWVEEDP